MHVDEAPAHDLAGGVDGLFALDRFLGYCGDLVALDADIAHRIEPGFRVDDRPLATTMSTGSPCFAVILLLVIAVDSFFFQKSGCFSFR